MISELLNAMLRILHIIIFVSFAWTMTAQQAPAFSQFFHQKNIFNPAAAGSQDHTSLTLFHRQQWVGLEGAPSTQALNLSAAAFAERVGLGLTVLNDRIGFFNTTHVNMAYAYRVKMEEGTISLGMSGSYLLQQADWGEARTIGFGNDPNASGDGNVPVFNFGIGSYFENERFFFGLSVPYILEKGMTRKTDGVLKNGRGWVRHLFMQVGTVFYFSDKIKIRPALAARIVEDSPPGFDAHLSFGLLPESKLWLGGTWRWSQSEVAAIGDAVVFMGQYRIGEKLRVGFGYEYTMSEIQSQTSGTYELMVQYVFQKKEVEKQIENRGRYFE